MIFSPAEDSLWLVVASIPLFAALPIMDNFDTLANWRVLIAVLFLCLFFKKGVSLNILRDKDGKWRIKENLKHYKLEYLVIPFLLISAFSIGVADYKVLAVKKFLFLVNIFLLFLIVRNLTRDKESIISVWRAAAVGGITAVFIALFQFFSVFFAPLIVFWQFWANRVINFFYGQNLTDLLSRSNTWFAYYKSAPPTLRLFSIFPDSHSFAMFCLLAAPILAALGIYYQNSRRLRTIFSVFIGLALFGAVFSGSRGVSLP